MLSNRSSSLAPMAFFPTHTLLAALSEGLAEAICMVAAEAMFLLDAAVAALKLCTDEWPNCRSIGARLNTAKRSSGV